jgi:hypothetical protein
MPPIAVRLRVEVSDCMMAGSRALEQEARESELSPCAAPLCPPTCRKRTIRESRSTNARGTTQGIDLAV